MVKLSFKWGKYSGFTSGASKVAGTAAQVGNIAGTVGQVAQTGKQLVDVGKSLGVDKLFKKKDKPCNDVAKKDIVIGEHGIQVQPNSSPVSNVSNDNSPKMTTIISIAEISSSD